MSPAPVLWEVQKDQMSFQDRENLFCIKHISITAQDFCFFYAAKYTQTLSAKTAAFSVFEHDEKDLHSRTQLFGYLLEYEIGVIYVERISKKGQAIVLKITPPESPTFTRRLTPLLQVEEEYHVETSRYVVATPRTCIPEIEFHGPIEKQQIGFFRPVVSGKTGLELPHIFLKMENFNAVQITQDEYLKYSSI